MDADSQTAIVAKSLILNRESEMSQMEPRVFSIRPATNPITLIAIVLAGGFIAAALVRYRHPAKPQPARRGALATVALPSRCVSSSSSEPRPSGVER